MANFKFELDKPNVGLLLKSSEMQDVLTQEAQKVTQSIGGNFNVDVTTRPTRSVAEISCNDAQTYYKNRKHNLLLKAIKGGSS